MTTSRYVNRGVFQNEDRGYVETLFDARDIKVLLQYETARFYYPTIQERQSMNLSTEVWTSTSKLYNLANDIYGDPKLWWVIAWFNQKPTEAHFKTGDILYIPNSAREILGFFRKQNGDSL